MKKISTRALTQIALLIALAIILNGPLSIQAPIVRTLNFSFLPIAIIAMLHGPLLGGMSAAVADVVGFFLFPGPWPFFPGFTISAFATGVIFGIFLYKIQKGQVWPGRVSAPAESWLRVVVSVLVITVVVRLGLNILWLSMMWGDAFLVLLPPRIIGALAMVPIQVICIRAVASERFSTMFGVKPVPQ